MQAKTGYIAVILLIASAVAVDCWAHNPPGKAGYDMPLVDKSGALDDLAPRPIDGGIREEIPAKYQSRFDKWKSELTSTDFGRELWDRFATDRSFVLRIVISRKQGRGGWVGNYKRDYSGKLVGATITIGHELDEGYPSAVYYPVLNSLKLIRHGASVLAAAKLAHELGHVSVAANADFRVIQLQDRLTKLYNQRLSRLGLNEQDRILFDLADQMGGTPEKLTERGEYASEVFTYRYVESRIEPGKKLCRVVRQVRRNLEGEAPEYSPYFEPHLKESNCYPDKS